MAANKPLADTAALFQACRRIYSEPEARVASECLYWSQHAKSSLRGKVGFYKEDKDLADALGKHRKTVGRTLMRLCAQEAGSALFEVDYGVCRPSHVQTMQSSGHRPPVER
jgi:hypothetical protein